MAQPFERIDPYFLDSFSRGGTIFVGAGVSMRAGMPSWYELIDPLKKYVKEAITQQSSLLDIAELYSVKYRRPALVHAIKQEIEKRNARPTKVQNLLVNLPIHRIFTTNFDTLLEMAAKESFIRHRVVVNAPDVAVSDASQLVIVKLHGDINQSDSLIITSRDYYSYFATHPTVADLLKVELQTRTVLFLGYSFSDPDLGMILSRIGEESGDEMRRMLYSVQFRPPELVKRALEARGVTVIPLDAEPNTPEGRAIMESWMSSFSDELVRRDRRKGGSYSRNVADLYSINSRFNLVPESKPAVFLSAPRNEIESGLLSDAPLIVVKGDAGIGKTQLTALVATEFLKPKPGVIVLSNTFRQVVWIPSAGDDEEGGRTLSQVLDAIASSLEAFALVTDSHDDQASHDDQEEKCRGVENLLAEHKVIVVIDDLSDEKDGNDLIDWLGKTWSEMRAKSKIIVNSRATRLRGYNVKIDELSGKEAMQMLREQERELRLRRSIPEGLRESEIEQLATKTRGNPQAMRLAVGVIAGCRDPAIAIDTLSKTEGKSIEEVFEALLDTALTKLSKLDGQARIILETMPVFPLSRPIPALLLRIASGLDDNQFAKGIDECLMFGLFDRNPVTEAFSVHPVLIKYLKTHQAPGNSAIRDIAYQRLAEYLIGFLKKSDVIWREDIGEAYWATLVRPEMAKVDPYWPVIKEVMLWAERDHGRDRFLIELVLLLVHYMDSRFLNAERLHFVHKAADALKRQGKKQEEAWLHIDALGWTYIEEGNFLIARQEITKGSELVSNADGDGFSALALAWLARVQSLENGKDEAERLVLDALRNVDQLKAWIAMRVHMAAGDVKLKGEKPDPNAAIEHYQKAQELAETYGEEGNGYQTDHRLGMAYLRNKDVDRARRIFESMAEEEHVSIERLYGQYGLALIEASDGRLREDAKARLQVLRHEIRRRTRRNILLDLAEEAFKDLSEND